MNRDDVIRMAREAGIEVHPRKGAARIGADALLGLDSTEKLERFAELVKAEFLERTGQYLTNDATREAALAEAVSAEREACAAIADECAANWWALRGQMSKPSERRHLHSKLIGAEQVAATIRARGAEALCKRGAA